MVNVTLDYTMFWLGVRVGHIRDFLYSESTSLLKYVLYVCIKWFGEALSTVVVW